MLTPVTGRNTPESHATQIPLMEMLGIEPGPDVLIMGQAAHGSDYVGCRGRESSPPSGPQPTLKRSCKKQLNGFGAFFEKHEE